MYLKVALIEVAIDKMFISEEDAMSVYAEIQTLSVQEVATKVNISPVPLDSHEIIMAVKRAISDNPKAVADYLAGKDKAINKVMGQVMMVTRGRNDAEPLLEMIKSRIVHFCPGQVCHDMRTISSGFDGPDQTWTSVYVCRDCKMKVEMDFERGEGKYPNLLARRVIEKQQFGP